MATIGHLDEVAPPQNESYGDVEHMEKMWCFYPARPHPSQIWS